MLRVNVQIEIEAAPEYVFAYVADMSNNPEWQSGVTSTEWQSEPPLRVGSTCEQTMGDDTVIEYLVTALNPGRSITVTTQAGAAIPATVTRTVQNLGASRARVKMDLVGKVRGWRILTTPLIRRLVRQTISSDYRRLKRVLEDR